MINSINKRYWLGAGFIASSLLVFSLIGSALAAPVAQIPIYSPTPGPDGRIIYIVQPNDTLTRISLIFGVSEDELRGLNNLTGDTIVVGQELLIGLGGPAQTSPTPGPSPTPTTILPTPSPKPGSGNLCILLFEDLNGDAIRQEEEPSIPGGAISVNNRTGSVSLTATTSSGSDPYCFEKVPEGDYTVSVAVPSGYNPTTINSYALSLKAGDETYLDFGAQVNSVNEAQAPVPTEEGRSPLLGIIGIIFLLGGAGLALFAGRLLKAGR
jgi:murein DD-endopeptidase MepM/ murein hydrolase activator NlpD